MQNKNINKLKTGFSILITIIKLFYYASFLYIRNGVQGIHNKMVSTNRELKMFF